MTEEAEIIPLEEIVPAERPPEMTREVFLSPPDWRYQAACKYLEDERNGETPTIPTDPVVLLVIRALRAFRRVPNRLYMDALWNTTEEVIRLGTTMRHSAIVAEMESHLISGHSAKDLKAIYSCPIPGKVYELYAKVFFDLTGITAIHSWIHDFLFEPERHHSNQILLRARLLSYYKDAGSGAKAAILGMRKSTYSAPTVDGVDALDGRIFVEDAHMTQSSPDLYETEVGYYRRMCSVRIDFQTEEVISNDD